MHFNRRHNNNFRQQPKPAITKPPVNVPPVRTYTDADIHVDVVDLSFNDIRKVEVGKYDDGTPKVEYVSEAEAAALGLQAEWQKALPMDEYKQNSND